MSAINFSIASLSQVGPSVAGGANAVYVRVCSSAARRSAKLGEGRGTAVEAISTIAVSTLIDLNMIVLL
jgi:hypothetical protein